MTQELVSGSELTVTWTPKDADGADETTVDLREAAALGDFLLAPNVQLDTSYPAGHTSPIVTPTYGGLRLAAPGYAGARVRAIAEGLGTLKVGVTSMGVAVSMSGRVVDAPNLAETTFDGVVRPVLAFDTAGAITQTVSDDDALSVPGLAPSVGGERLGVDKADARVPASDLVLKTAPAGSALVALGVDHGLANVRPSFPLVLPGRQRTRGEFDGSVSTVGGGFRTGRLRWFVNLTAATKMLWLMANGSMGAAGNLGAPFDVEYGPYGSASGMPKITGRFVTIPTFGHAGGVLGFSVEQILTGALTVGAYA